MAPTNYSFARIVTDEALVICRADDNYRRMYNVAPDFVPGTLADVVSDRMGRGWLSLAEILDTSPSVKTRIDEIRSGPARSTLQFSPHGDVIIASHALDAISGKINFAYSVSPYKLAAPPSSREGRLILNWLRDLFALGAPIAALIGGVCSPDLGGRGSNFLANRSGDFVLLGCRDDLEVAFRDHANLEDFNIDVGSFMDAVTTKRQVARIVDHAALGTCILSARLVEVYRDGPRFIGGRISPIGDVVSTETVRDLFPRFTQQEAAAVAAIAQGRTIKRAADTLLKSPVTVALQARSALHKSGFGTIEELSARILVASAANEFVFL